MHSELHERLEYLVNYSSQLIFVSGDSIAEQQKTLDAFVFQQHDDTEIAYLTAQEGMDISDYRRQLCRQLLGQVVGSYVRPLRELLSPLNHHEGPILLAITQAQFISDTLLQELWDVVLQSRQAGNKQHLNVLLFGDSRWAEKAKQWLPAKNNDTPLLISSQSVNADAALATPSSTLDKMIAERREAFQAHLDKRKALAVLDRPTNPLKSKAIMLSLLVVFSLTFLGLVTWQYGARISSLFEPIESEETVDEKPSVTPGSAYANVAALEDSIDDVIDPLPIETQQPSGSSNPTIEIVSNQQGTDKLVTDWQEAIENQADTDSNDTALAGTIAESTIAEDTTLNDTEEVVTPTNTLQQPERTAIQAPAINDDAALLLDDSALPPTISDTQASWITSEQFVIQMVAMKDRTVVDEFIEDYQLSNVTRVYTTQRYGGNWYVIIFHQLFSSQGEARDAMKTLPTYPGKNDAFIKSGVQVMKELSEQ
ncbi:SPOR domain-containing protein [Alteromonas sp. A079]|uniref:SPOR domain-containing protein n=1 Tax=Alteromonas sp. A079 TaxID=3410268 RepID=UPI003BA1DC0D